MKLNVLMVVTWLLWKSSQKKAWRCEGHASCPFRPSAKMPVTEPCFKARMCCLETVSMLAVYTTLFLDYSQILEWMGSGMVTFKLQVLYFSVLQLLMFEWCSRPFFFLYNLLHKANHRKYMNCRERCLSWLKQWEMCFVSVCGCTYCWFFFKE